MLSYRQSRSRYRCEYELRSRSRWAEFVALNDARRKPKDSRLWCHDEWLLFGGRLGSYRQLVARNHEQGILRGSRDRWWNRRDPCTPPGVPGSEQKCRASRKNPADEQCRLNPRFCVANRFPMVRSSASPRNEKGHFGIYQEMLKSALLFKSKNRLTFLVK